MKRFHVHISVDNLSDNIRFYSALFNQEPIVAKPDYAKWMLDDPRINFAISQRGTRPGVDHLGIQVESSEELEELKNRLAATELPVSEQSDAVCCYARSDKQWTVDPQGVPWETFHTLANAPVFGSEQQAQRAMNSCCAPNTQIQLVNHKPKECC